MFEYEGTRRICYGEDGATFIPVCEKCGRFVKPDELINFMVCELEEKKYLEPNATCKKCGRINMIFEGYY